MKKFKNIKQEQKYIRGKKSTKEGFTLIETLVSLALFSIVLVISGGVIMSVINVEKKNQIISAVVNNLNYSIDSMVRDIKTGYLYKCDYSGSFTIDALKADTEKRQGLCQNSLTLVSTITGNDIIVKYELINPSNTNSYIQKTIYDSSGNPSSYSITDKNDVKIEKLNLTVKNPDALDVTNGVYGQPSVFITIKGIAGKDTVDASKFFVQTFISQRLINVTDFKDNN